MYDVFTIVYKISYLSRYTEYKLKLVFCKKHVFMIKFL
jgi:hypothetical protein